MKPRTRRIMFLAFAAAAARLPLQAQSPSTFEVVSIKPNRSGDPGSDTNTTPGRLSLVNVTARSLLLRAFGVQATQIVDAPGWVETERFDILAVTGGAHRLTDQERQPFIQAMLAERFQLKFHRETKELRVYSLTVSKNGSKLAAYGGKGDYSMKVAVTQNGQVLRSTKGNIQRLVEMLSGFTGRMVSNETGLSGEYDFTLEWVPDENTEAIGPSLFTALEQQLGLKLESIKRPVEVIVIDHIERPSAN